MELIDYTDKVALYQNNDIADINKVNAGDMNKIKSVVNGALQGTNAMGNVRVDSIKSKNMFSFDLATIVTTNKITYTTTSNSITQTNTGTYSRSSTRIYNTKVGTQYTLSCNFTNSSGSNIRMLVYDSTEANQLGATDNTTSTSGTLTITFTSTDTAICMHLYSNNSGSSSTSTVTFSNIQLEEGSTKTTFSPYQNLNSNDVYSSNEIKIGTWVDGSPIYRKYFTFDTKTDSYELSISATSQASNLTLIDIKGFVIRTDYPNLIMPIPSRVTNAQYLVEYKYIARETSRFVVDLLWGSSLSSTNVAKIYFVIDYAKAS